MHYQRLAIMSLACVTLSACGGGSGSVGSTPLPPVARTNSALTNLQYSEDFVGRAAVIQYSIARATGGATQRGSGGNLGALIRYDASAQSYTLTGTTLPASTFAPSHRLAASSGPVITAYQKTSGNRQENLALFNAGAANTELALTYASYGALQTITDNGATLDVDTGFFTYGVLTAASDMPRTGSSTYRTKIDGQFADNSGAYSLSGTSSFAADFGAGTIAFSMNPVGQNVVTGSVKSLGSHSINASIVNNRFSSGGFSGGTYSSSLEGYFYGPAAAEIGGTFTLTGGGGAGGGIVVGKKN